MTKPKMMKQKPTTKTKTRFLGVYALEEGRWLIRAVARHPRTKVQVAREKAVVCATVEEAATAREVLAETLRIELTEPEATTTPRATTVADYAERWLSRKSERLRASVVDHYLDVLGKRVLPVLGEINLKDLVRSDLERWVIWAEKQRSRHDQAYARDTLNGWWRVLRNFARDAAADFGIADPTRRIAAPESKVRNVSEHRALTGVQVALLLATVKRTFPQWYAETHLCVFTGMRPSELYGLRWADIDFSAGVARLERSADARRQLENPPKTGAPREVALTPEMKDVLQAHRQEMLRGQHPGLASGLVFPNEHGEFRGAPALYRVLNLAARTAGIPVRVGPKTLRKTYVTLATFAGLDRLAIQGNVGHSGEEMTERYAWVSTDEKRKVTEAIEGLVPSRG